MVVSGGPGDAVTVFVEPAVGPETRPQTPIDRQADSARLLDGFKAHQAGDATTAIELLRQPAGALDDWRLLILAESAHETGDPDLAAASLDSLIADHPGSPIHSLALLRAAEIAAEHRPWDQVLPSIERARARELPEDKALAIETLAWKIGIEHERPEIQTEAGRRLLIEHPRAAADLGVEAFFRDPRGELVWGQILTPAELARRAERQIEERDSDEALITLDRVPEDQRSFAWTLLRAEALTRDRRGVEALKVLDGLDSSDPERRIDIAWQRALAAREAGRVRRGRANLSQSRREEMRALARANLVEVADLTTDPERRLWALKVLFILVSDQDDSFESSLAILDRLRQLDPGDTTGTSYLWRLGWQAYTQRNYPGAIGYWSELEDMYPGTTSARSGRYWTGRAHEALGHADRATDIYREILSAKADDFYSRHARSRVETTVVEPGSQPRRPTEPWPEDPILERAVWLHRAGLDDLALHELDGLEALADHSAFCAQKALVLAGLGRRRESIQSLVCAFPALGKAHQNIVPEDVQRLYYPLDFRSIIEQRAREQQLPVNLVFAMVRQESAFDSEARSWAGARGLMQLMPATGREVAQRLGLRYSTSRLHDPDFSVRLGTRYFRQVLDMFDGNQELALAGYNGGPYRIKKLWRQAGSRPELDRFVEGLSLEETKTYVKRILLFEDSYQRLYPTGS
jgi:soluble lytic murein transglycosylase-like protein